MKIFRVVPDPSSAPIVLTDAGAIQRILPFDGQRKTGMWDVFGRSGPSFRSQAPSSRCNFFAFHPAVLVYDEAVANAADREELFSDGGEWLPGHLEDPAQALNVLNITECYNCLDLANSEFESGSTGSWSCVKKHVFHPDRITDSTLFKIPQTKDDTIYCLSGRGDGNLRDFCQVHGFSGLQFHEVWSV